ncbi:hypothetical protein TTHERM_000691639 (macronuclear) [Tetrahymena thermophila SB210]|uniref:Uncharacterized protein n=1 Tax=Tetrahymena thermophila (strain SB210) TaxID=312017 RepID=W7X717_TETTS|nr:hypothetical protein TTHERM_000691639 [Tetrahymena thermophila SB210]EWS72188.1 hypothetical protein TTHERM_000691639 [Tetrahymena thermophila SB210]|eukprot:XP_012655281.1 hypothetical protein TTHERM_000691639 [Tetrahymena thermophila SB210]
MNFYKIQIHQIIQNKKMSTTFQKQNLNIQNIKQTVKYIMETQVPLYIGFELRSQQKQIKYFSSTYEKVQIKINNIFQEYGPINVQDSVLSKIYEGIVDIKRVKNKSIMIFKDIVDAEFIKLYYVPHQIEELSIFKSTDKDLNIIIIQFNDSSS